MNPKSELLSEAGEVWIQSSRRDADGGGGTFFGALGVLRLDLSFTHKSPPSHSTPIIPSRSPKVKLISAYGTDTIRSIGSRHTQIGSLKENITDRGRFRRSIVIFLKRPVWTSMRSMCGIEPNPHEVLLQRTDCEIRTPMERMVSVP